MTGGDPGLEAALEAVRAGPSPWAESVCREILDRDPGHAGALHVLGIAAYRRGALAEAAALFADAVAADGRHAPAHHNFGMACAALGRVAEAAAAFRMAIALDPSLAATHFSLGTLLQTQGRLAEAAACYVQALTHRPGYGEALYNLGCVLQVQGRLREAQARFRDAARVLPGLAEIHNNAALVEKALGRADAAAAACRRALIVNPAFAEAWSNLAVALHEQGLLPATAAACCRRALALRPDYPEAWNNLGMVLLGAADPRGAETACRAAVALKPDYAEARYNLALTLLTLGAFDAAWVHYDCRHALRAVAPARPGPAVPPWCGQDPAGRRLLIHAEQGIGDTLQFARLIAPLAARGAGVVFEVPRALRALMAGLRVGTGARVEIIGQGEPLPPVDFTLPLMSLARWLGVTGPDRIPAEIPYLAAEPDRVAAWGARLGTDGLRIGVVWQGNPAARIDRGRSLPLAALAPVARLPGVRLISLQKLHGLDQIAPARETVPVECLDGVDCGRDAFVDTAAILMSLDLVVCSDTAIAHLAGALGRPVWVLLKHAPDWRWLLGRDDSPWYPTMRLFRQPQPGDWAGAVATLAAALERSF